MMPPLCVAYAISVPAAGGAEVYVKDLAKTLAGRGHRPLILFVSRATDQQRSETFERAYLQDLTAAGIAYAFIGHECRRDPLLGALRVRRLCRQHGVHIYHSHLKYALAFGALLRIPHVHTHHNFEPHVPLWMYRLFNRLVDSYVGISNVCSDSLRSYTRRPVTTIHNAVDPARVVPGGALARELGKPLNCIAVGRLNELKNHGPLIQALAILPRESQAAVRVIIAGEGSARTRAGLEAQVKQSGLDGIVRLLGNREDVPELLRDSQLFLMSSASEGFPISLIEATVAGLPFVATDVGGCPEVAAKCGNGLIVPPNDPAALAGAIQSLLDDPDRFRGLSANAVENGPLFAIDPCADKHLQLYGNLLGS